MTPRLFTSAACCRGEVLKERNWRAALSDLIRRSEDAIATILIVFGLRGKVVSCIALEGDAIVVRVTSVCPGDPGWGLWPATELRNYRLYLIDCEAANQIS